MSHKEQDKTPTPQLCTGITRDPTSKPTSHAAYANTTIMHYETHFTMPRYACHSLRPQTLLKNKEAVCSQLTLILEVVSLKCSVGPSGRCEITIPLGFFLSSFITITSVQFLSLALSIIFLRSWSCLLKNSVLGIVAANCLQNTCKIKKVKQNQIGYSS